MPINLLSKEQAARMRETALPDVYTGDLWAMSYLTPEEKKAALWDTRDQGWCGSSWAVAPAAAISVRLSIQTSTYKNNFTKISREAILSCGATAWECGGGKDDLPEWQQEILRNFHGTRSCDEPSEWGCQGGDVTRAWSYMEGHG